MTTASKGASEKRKLTQYVTQQFVLHFNEQFRILDELTDLSERMPESIKMALLQNAGKDIPQLSIVETLVNIPPQPLEQGHAHISPTHPTTMLTEFQPKRTLSNSNPNG